MPFFAETFPMLPIRAFLLMALVLFFVVACVRVAGLRSFSKMTSFDFVLTVAMGTLLAGAVTATSWERLAYYLFTVASLFTLQFCLSKLRVLNDTVEDAIGNDPRLLMFDGQMLDTALRETRVTKADVMAKLREANALDFGKVRAVVLETTGDISVLHGDQFDDRLLKNVRGYPDAVSRQR